MSAHKMFFLLLQSFKSMGKSPPEISLKWIECS